jgi:hypothetical protein
MINYSPVTLRKLVNTETDEYGENHRRVKKN